MLSAVAILHGVDSAAKQEKTNKLCEPFCPLFEVHRTRPSDALELLRSDLDWIACFGCGLWSTGFASVKMRFEENASGTS